jgi:hypothetical protein
MNLKFIFLIYQLIVVFGFHDAVLVLVTKLMDSIYGRFQVVMF